MVRKASEISLQRFSGIGASLGQIFIARVLQSVALVGEAIILEEVSRNQVLFEVLPLAAHTATTAVVYYSKASMLGCCEDINGVWKLQRGHIDAE